VQVFLLNPSAQPETDADGVSIERINRAEDNGLRVTPEAGFRDELSR